MVPYDDDLTRFAAEGAAPLRVTDEKGMSNTRARGSGMQLIDLAAVSHFAPLQRPDQFNPVLLAFLGQVLA